MFEKLGLRLTVNAKAEINGKASISHTAFKQVRSTHVAARQCSTTSTEPPKQPSRNAVEPSGAVRLVEALCYAWQWWLHLLT